MGHSRAVVAGVKGSGVHEASAPLSRRGPSKAACSLLGCRLSVSQCPGGANSTPHPWRSPPQPWGDVSEHVGSAFQAHGEDSEGDTATIKALLSPCSLGTCLVGAGDG